VTSCATGEACKPTWRFSLLSDYRFGCSLQYINGRPKHVEDIRQHSTSCDSMRQHSEELNVNVDGRVVVVEMNIVEVAFA